MYSFDTNAYSQYPRPLLVRDSFLNLNGEWTLTVPNATAGTPARTIVVPFPVEAQFPELSADTYTYTRTFRLPAGFLKGRLLLHFGAVDQIAEVYVDDRLYGRHEGGYLPFTLDITDCLSEDPAGVDSSIESLVHTLRVEVTDTLSHIYPWGKQKKNRGGMWYTPVSGIWQTVWLESVSNLHIDKLVITPGLDSLLLRIEAAGINARRTAADGNETSGGKVEGVKTQCIDITVYAPVTNAASPVTDHLSDAPLLHLQLPFDRHSVAAQTTLKIPNPLHWTPETPTLYPLRITLGTDSVLSYFALRTVSIGEIRGQKRILLNGQPYFFHGVLDQGYFARGIYTADSEEEYQKDILRMKALGFNMLRKHIKIEPACFYEYCDRLGMVVFQDMVSNGDYSFLRDTAFPNIGIRAASDRKPALTKKTRETHRIFEQHMIDTAAYLHNVPSIVYYTIFNEGWGQFDSNRLYGVLKDLEPTRIIDSTSGWFQKEKSDVESKHIYFRAIKPQKHDRPIIVSEFGGYSYRVPGHSYSKVKAFGYAFYSSTEALSDAIRRLYEEEVIPYIERGLCGAVYTQLSDVEDEINGFYTYDREVLKVLPEAMTAVADGIRDAMSKI